MVASRALNSGVNTALARNERGVAAAQVTTAEAFWAATAGGGEVLGLPVVVFAPVFEFDALVVDVAAPQSNIALWPGLDSAADVFRQDRAQFRPGQHRGGVGQESSVPEGGRADRRRSAVLEGPQERSLRANENPRRGGVKVAGVPFARHEPARTPLRGARPDRRAQALCALRRRGRSAITESRRHSLTLGRLQT